MVESAELPKGTVRFPAEFTHGFIAAVFRAVGVPEDHARLMADVLTSADLRGIRSHGMARVTAFLSRLEKGVINKRPGMKLHPGSDVTAVIDADGALGPVGAHAGMEEAIRRADRHGAGFVAVRNCSHLGYVGYWAKMAMERGFIGLSMTNGGGVVTPTFGVDPILGTNPMSVAFPGGPGGHSYHLDMATASVARGKVETYLREGKKLPKGWVSEAYGEPRLDERGILTFDVPLLPLGGEGTEGGGHKGYGLSLMVELFCGILSGSDLGVRIAGATGDAAPGTGHFLGAIKLAGFCEPTQAHTQMQQTFDRIRNSRKAPGHGRIYIHGEPEAIAEAENRRLGVPITPAVLDQMRKMNARLRLGYEV
ncbi:MAG: Ldh family oxidoreductase [Candidatus Tectomicrobia bacterium]|nr:Ldh family oxidoreductase [Candidatus Tectomicrobia bacterium]